MAYFSVREILSFIGALNIKVISLIIIYNQIDMGHTRCPVFHDTEHLSFFNHMKKLGLLGKRTKIPF